MISTSYADKTIMAVYKCNTEVVNGAYGICWKSEIYKDTFK